MTRARTAGALRSRSPRSPPRSPRRNRSRAAEEPKPSEPEEKPEPEKPAASSGGGDATPVLMPELGESVTEGTVTRWLKKVGDSVEVDEPLVEVSTDKVDTEIPSPVAGTLVSITAEEDDTVAVGGELAKIGDAGAAPAEKPEPKPEPKEEAKEEPDAGTEARAETGAQGRGQAANRSPSRNRSPNLSRSRSPRPRRNRRVTARRT